MARLTQIPRAATRNVTYIHTHTFTMEPRALVSMRASAYINAEVMTNTTRVGCVCVCVLYACGHQLYFSCFTEKEESCVTGHRVSLVVSVIIVRSRVMCLCTRRGIRFGCYI